MLAGDAAHVHSPAGGQGMNTGIQDALALGRALVAALRGPEGEAALDAYEQTRRPIARRVVAFTDRMTRAATLRTRRARAIRNSMIGLVGRTPAREWLAGELAGLHHA
jgi:2-polyprenyl-6-methoxyphenol hydroxylase-like FAD-dependent oxidoreductase